MAANLFSTLRRFTFISALMLCMVFGMGHVASAQTEPESAPVSAAGKSDVSFSDLLKKGGWAMWPLGLLSVTGLGLIIYNGMVIRRRQFLRPDVVENLKEALNELNIEKARAICDQTPTAASNIVYAGLERIQDDEIDLESVEKAMEEASSEEMSGPFALINYLSIIASVSPMVGLLGTVSGMVKAFNSIAAQGMGKPELLANNISEALITTATGLIVAIPAMVFYFYFKNKFGKLSSVVNRITGDLYFTLVHALKRQAQ